MPRRRILVVTSTFPRWEGDSTPRFVHDLAVATSSEFDVTVLAPHHPGARRRERMGPLDVRRFAYFAPSAAQRLCYDGGILPKLEASRLARVQLPAFLAAELAAIVRMLATETFDLLHAHWMVPQGILAAIATLAVRRPLVVSAHGSDVFALRGAAFDRARRWLARRARAVTVNSEATREELARAIPRLRADVVPMGVDVEIRDENANAARDHGPLVFVGRLSRQKNVGMLLEAFAALSARAPEMRLEIVGDGPSRAALERRAAELSIQSRVTFAGARPRDDVLARLRRARAFVFPARSEAQGVAVIEAMACGCPVVATRSGALGALLGDDERGLGVDDDDARALAGAIVRAFVERDATAARARAAQAFVAERYALRAIAPRMTAVYRRVLEERAWG
jgi:glycosyltransferase involved in cell wall biosynthesis